MRILFLTMALCAALPLAAFAAEKQSLPFNSNKPDAARLAAEAAPGPPAGVIPFPDPGLIYTPITPCRAFDTRGGELVKTRTFLVSGGGDFTSQGGPANGCGLPPSATAVQISMTTSSSTAVGNLRVSAPGVILETFAVSYRPGESETSSSIVAIGENSITARALVGKTHLTGDIVGYFAPQLAAYLNSDGTLYSATARVVSSEKNFRPGRTGSRLIATSFRAPCL